MPANTLTSSSSMPIVDGDNRRDAAGTLARQVTAPRCRPVVHLRVGQAACTKGTCSPFHPALPIGGWIAAPATGPAPGEEES